jgi:hypothetical protein
MSRRKVAGLQAAVILSVSLVIAVPSPHAIDLETTIDLNYTYDQTHLGDNITGATSVQQKYNIIYGAMVTPLFEMLADITLDLANTSGDKEADTSKMAPSLTLSFTGPRAVIRFAYDSAMDKTEVFEENAESETFSTNYLFEFEVTPDYWPEARIKIEKKRSFEELRTEDVEKSLGLDIRKDIGDLSLEFDFEYRKTDVTLPGPKEGKEIGWSGKIAYQSTVWRDVDVDLTYEIKQDYSEDFEKGVFVGEDEDYAHEIQARLRKSLILTPRLAMNLEYEYQLVQDLGLLDRDIYNHELTQTFALDLTYEIFRWLEVFAGLEREIKKDVIGDDKLQLEGEVKDMVTLAFDADPTRWLTLAGQAEWNFDEKMGSFFGASVDSDDDASYELSMRHSWGSFWDLTVTGSSEYEYTDGWLTKEEGDLKTDLALTFFDNFIIDSSYEIERSTEYEERSPLALNQGRREEFRIKFEFNKDFTDMIQTAFAHEFGMTWEEEVDEVMNFDEVTELSEDTRIKVALVDFIRDMTLEGEITRKATDTKDDEEPVLVDITYALKLDWVIGDVDLGASFKYDDNGDTFDESSFNTKVAWTRETFDVSGEYQFDKTYSDEIDEQRKLNLNMNVLF